MILPSGAAARVTCLRQDEAFRTLDGSIRLRVWRDAHVCGSGSDVAAVRSAVDREAEDASREQKLRENGDLHV